MTSIDIEKEGTTGIIRVARSEYKGKDLVDVRLFYLDKETGEYMPTRKGISITIDLIPKVIQALTDLQ